MKGKEKLKDSGDVDMTPSDAGVTGAAGSGGGGGGEGGSSSNSNSNNLRSFTEIINEVRMRVHITYRVLCATWRSIAREAPCAIYMEISNNMCAKRTWKMSPIPIFRQTGLAM